MNINISLRNCQKCITILTVLLNKWSNIVPEKHAIDVFREHFKTFESPMKLVWCLLLPAEAHRLWLTIASWGSSPGVYYCDLAPLSILLLLVPLALMSLLAPMELLSFLAPSHSCQLLHPWYCWHFRHSWNCCHFRHPWNYCYSWHPVTPSTTGPHGTPGTAVTPVTSGTPDRCLI